MYFINVYFFIHHLWVRTLNFLKKSLNRCSLIYNCKARSNFRNYISVKICEIFRFITLLEGKKETNFFSEFCSFFALFRKTIRFVLCRAHFCSVPLKLHRRNFSELATPPTWRAELARS